MRIIEGLKMREVCGCYIVVGAGVRYRDFNKMLNLNKTAAYLWESVEGKDFTEETLKDLLTARYDVSEETALADSRKLIEDWKSAGVIE